MLPVPNEDLKEIRKRDLRVRKVFHKNKMGLLEDITKTVRKESIRRKLPKTDSLVQALEECSGKDRFAFKSRLQNYANEMEGCTAYIEAGLARNAIEDLDEGDYRSSRIKRYERFLEEVLYK
ncbi:MAG: hypothetical protein AABX29_00745 [Nanoarchaeota archaeon]